MIKITRSNVLTILLFLLIISLPVVLIGVYLLNSFGHFFSISFLIATAIFGYVARKEWYVHQVSPKLRRLQFVM